MIAGSAKNTYGLKARLVLSEVLAFFRWSAPGYHAFRCDLIPGRSHTPFISPGKLPVGPGMFSVLFAILPWIQWRSWLLKLGVVRKQATKTTNKNHQLNGSSKLLLQNRFFFTPSSHLVVFFKEQKRLHEINCRITNSGLSSAPWSWDSYDAWKQWTTESCKVRSQVSAGLSILLLM